MNKVKNSPWKWIPTLYFAQGIPYVVAMSVAVIMYKRLGISNTEIALYTSWLYLPWVIKPFWSPFIDILKTKRWWILTMQLLIGAGLGAVAFLIPMPFFFQASLAVLWLIAFSSATHDIAADGFYMLALDSGEQSFFVGIRSTFYRLAMITGQGILIIMAGSLEASTGKEPLLMPVEVSAELSNGVSDFEDAFLFSDAAQTESFYMYPASLNIELGTISQDSANAQRSRVQAYNEAHGFVIVESKADVAAVDAGESAWSRYVANPLRGGLERMFGVEQAEYSAQAGNIGVVAIRLKESPKADEQVVLNMSQSKGDNSISLVSGERLVFTSENWDEPAYVMIQIDPKLSENQTAEFKGLSGNIPLAWSITFFVLAGFFIAVFVYHRFVLPRPESDHSSSSQTAGSILKEFGYTFKSFFQKPGIGVAIAFMLLYRLGEAMLVKMSSPFLLDARDLGGLGLTTGQVGVVYGTVGVIALTLGGILGGIVASRRGLKFWIWPMALCITLPNLAYLYLASVLPESFVAINIAVAIEQFGYGFGFTAYMLYLIYISDGEHKTAHYALCTGFMALGMMLPGMVAGWLQEIIGYENFFIWVMGCAVITLSVIPFLKIDPEFGKKK